MFSVDAITAWLEKVWYKNSLWRYFLYPLTWLYRLVFTLQRRTQLQEQNRYQRPAVPVIIVGNISVGGTGKTPLTLTLLNYLSDLGYKPGVISRGYGGHPPYLPYPVEPASNPEFSGDEPLLIRRRSGCPVVVDPDRQQALSFLTAQFHCDIVVSDDGLQHHRLPRDVEIVVIDGQRRLGNGLCLPAGPLREPPSRLTLVDFVISNGCKIPEARHLMTFKPTCFKEVGGERVCALDSFENQKVNAIAGIGNPQRFFESLEKLNISVQGHAFADHHGYTAEELTFARQAPLLMTEKDAMKCAGLGLRDAWYLQIEAELQDTFLNELSDKLTTVKNNLSSLRKVS